MDEEIELPPESWIRPELEVHEEYLEIIYAHHLAFCAYVDARFAREEEEREEEERPERKEEKLAEGLRD